MSPSFCAEEDVILYIDVFMSIYVFLHFVYTHSFSLWTTTPFSTAVHPQLFNSQIISSTRKKLSWLRKSSQTQIFLIQIIRYCTHGIFLCEVCVFKHLCLANKTPGLSIWLNVNTMNVMWHQGSENWNAIKPGIQGVADSWFWPDVPQIPKPLPLHNNLLSQFRYARMSVINISATTIFGPFSWFFPLFWLSQPKQAFGFLKKIPR